MTPKTANKAAGSETFTQRRTLPYWKSQREVLLDLLRSAAQRDAWLTLDEMAGETKFPPASISAQLRHLRKPQYGAWKVQRQQRKWGKAQLLWEYRLGS